MLKKFFIFATIFISLFCINYFETEQVSAQVLTGGVTAVPETFFGTWRVSSKLARNRFSIYI